MESSCAYNYKQRTSHPDHQPVISSDDWRFNSGGKTNPRRHQKYSLGSQAPYYGDSSSKWKPYQSRKKSYYTNQNRSFSSSPHPYGGYQHMVPQHQEKHLPHGGGSISQPRVEYKDGEQYFTSGGYSCKTSLFPSCCFETTYQGPKTTGYFTSADNDSASASPDSTSALSSVSSSADIASWYEALVNSKEPSASSTPASGPRGTYGVDSVYGEAAKKIQFVNSWYYGNNSSVNGK